MFENNRLIQPVAPCSHRPCPSELFERSGLVAIVEYIALSAATSLPDAHHLPVVGNLYNSAERISFRVMPLQLLETS